MELLNVIETKKTRRERGEEPCDYDVEAAKTKNPISGVVRFWMRTTIYKDKNSHGIRGDWYEIQESAYDLET